MEFILIFILLIPSVLGFSEIIYRLKSFIMSDAKKKDRILFLTLDNDDCIFQLKSFLNEFNWNGFKKVKKIYVVDCGLTKENGEQCELILKDYEIPILKKENMCEFLKEI